MHCHPSFLDSYKMGKTVELFVFLFDRNILFFKRPFLALDFFLFFYFFFVRRSMVIYIFFIFFLFLTNAFYCYPTPNIKCFNSKGTPIFTFWRTVPRFRVWNSSESEWVQSLGAADKCKRTEKERSQAIIQVPSTNRK